MEKNRITFFKIVGAAVAIVSITYLLRQFVTLTVSVPKVRIDVVVETTPGPTVARPTQTGETIASPTTVRPMSAVPEPTVIQPTPDPTPIPTKEITETSPVKKDPGQQSEPVAYYPFNGNADDESGNGNHGTVHGATLTADRFGNQDSAYLFDGLDDYIELPDGMDLVDTEFTTSAWIKPDDYGASNPLSQSCYRAIFAHRYRSQSSGNSTNGGLLFALREDSGCGGDDYMSLAFFRPDFRASGIATPGYGVAEWFLYTVTREPEELILYVNGEQVTSAEIPAMALYENPRHVYSSIGAQRAETWFAFPFDGVIDDVRVYNRALSAAEVERLYQLGQ